MSVPKDAVITCSTDAQCPADQRCSATLQRCVDAEANQAPSITFGAIPTGLIDLLIPITVFDQEGDDVSLDAALIVDGETSPITTVPNALTASADGEVLDLSVDTATFFGDSQFRAEIRLQLTPRDVTGIGSTVASEAFGVGNKPPEITFGDLHQDARPLGTASFVSSVLDVNVPVSQTLDVAIDFTLDDPADGNAQWWPLTHDPTSAQVVDLASVGDQTYVWDMLGDANAGHGLQATLLDTSDGASAPLDAARYAPSITLRAVVTDSDGLQSPTAIAELGPIGNDAPVATVEAARSGKRNIPIQVRLADSSADISDLEVQFRPEGETDFRTAKLVLSNSTSLSSSPSGVLHLVLWDSFASPDSDPSLAQGVGAVLAINTDIRVRAIDHGGETSGTAFYGPWSAVTTLDEVANQTAPRVENIDVDRLLLSDGATPVPIRYRVVDDESDPVDALFELSRDGGAHWQPCPQYPAPLSEEPKALLSAPSPGVEHVFIWDPTASTLAETTTLLLRISTTDGLHPDITSSVRTLSRTAQPSHEAPNDVFFVDTALVNFGGGPGNAGVATGDVNGDGIVDIVTCEDTGPTIQIHVGQGTDGVGDGAFVLPPANWYLAGGPPADLILTDIDNDEILDILTANGDGTVTRLLGSGINGIGDGTFEQPAVSFGSGGTIDAMATGDFDGDGALDIALARGQTGELDILTGEKIGNAPTGNFLDGLSMVVSSSAWDIAVADVDGDGDQDFLSVSGTDLELNIVLNDLDSSVPALNPVAAIPLLDEPHQLAVLDYNDDGVSDVAVAAVDSLWLFEGQTSAPYFHVVQVLPSAASCKQLRVADINGDGRDDIVSAEYAFSLTRGLSAHLGTGLGLAPAFSLTSEFGNRARDVALGDFNSDGRQDLAYIEVNSFGNHYIARTLVAPAQPAFTPAMFSDFSAAVLPADFPGPTPPVLRSGDFNGEGIWDLGFAGVAFTDTVGIGIKLGQGTTHVATGSFSSPTAHYVGEGVIFFETADLNHDGLWDLVFVRGTTDEFVTALATGGGNFSTPVASPIGGTAGGLFLADVTNDGILDALVPRANTLRLFVGGGTGGVGDGTFGSPTAIDAGSTVNTLVTADFDDDGFTDLVVNKFLGTSLLRGQGAGAFEAASDLAGVAMVGDAYAVDLNRDGVEDLVFSGGGLFGTPITVQLGQETGGFGNATFGPEQTYAPGGLSTPSSVAVTDANGDGILDLVGLYLDDATLWMYPGEATHGVPTGSFGAATPIVETPGLQRPSSLVVADFNSDGYADWAALDNFTNDLAWWFGQRQQHQAWSRTVRGFGDVAISQGTSLLGQTAAPNIIVRVADVGVDDFYSGLYHSPVAPPALSNPLTAPWLVDGLQTLKRVAPLAGQESQGEPLRVVERFGVLDLSNADVAQQRGIEVGLPLLGNTTRGELSNLSAVHLYRRNQDFQRASDPDYLPRVQVGAQTFADKILLDYTWDEIALDADSDFSTGSGERFYLELREVANPLSTDVTECFIHVLLDRPGTLQAFVIP